MSEINAKASDSFGLPDRTRQTIYGILRNYPNLERAVIYGSRAVGNYRPGSDIDMTLFGEHLDIYDLRHIAEDLDDSDIPYLVDLSIFADISNPDLKDHINRRGQDFWVAPKT